MTSTVSSQAEDSRASTGDSDEANRHAERGSDWRSEEATFARVLDKTLCYARERDYTGWDYGDGMSSQLLQRVPVENKWLNLAVQETVKRAPVNLRALFQVEQRRNYKGTGLFVLANLNVQSLLSASTSTASLDRPSASGLHLDSTVGYRDEAKRLSEWLLENRCLGYAGFCGGHRHRLQHLDCIGVPNDPDVVSTAYAVKALLRASSLEDRFADIARTAALFVVEDLDYREVEPGAVIDYYLNHPDDSVTLNAIAVGAGLFVDLAEQFDDPTYRERARELLDFVASKQSSVGGWAYRYPASSSHLSMDSHHNGFILENMLRYQSVFDSDRYEETLTRGLRFYRGLFDADGAPDFDESNAYPRDIHASTQGAVVFTRAGELERAKQILAWVLSNLYAGDGQFYFRKQRFYTKRITLMRWCEAWMAYVLSEYLLAVQARQR